MPMHSLVEYSDNYSKTSAFLWRYCREKPATIINNNILEIADLTEANLTDLFNRKVKLTDQTGDNGTKDFEIMVPLKYLSNFCRTLELSLINCEINVDLNWPEKFVMVANVNQGAAFSIADTKLYVPVVTL